MAERPSVPHDIARARIMLRGRTHRRHRARMFGRIARSHYTVASGLMSDPAVWDADSGTETRWPRRAPSLKNGDLVLIRHTLTLG